MTSRNWLFTSYKTEENFDFSENESVRYAIWQKEKCPTTNREHWQGYIEFNNGYRMAYVKNILRDGAAHLEQRRGTREQARDYCSKEESRLEGPFIYGEFEKGGQGQRNDLRAQAEIIKDIHRENPKTSLQVIAERHPEFILKYARGVQTLLQNLPQATRTEETKCILIVGPPGTGKSTWVRNNYPGSFWKQSGTHQWWDGYKGEETVVLDEFKGWIPATTFTQIVGNANECRVEIKGGTTQFTAKLVICISNFSPREWWEEGKVVFRAIERRFHEIIFFDSSCGLRRGDDGDEWFYSIERFKTWSDFEEQHWERQYV